MKTALASAPSASPPLPGRAKWLRAVHRSNSCTERVPGYECMHHQRQDRHAGMVSESKRSCQLCRCVRVCPLMTKQSLQNSVMCMQCPVILQGHKRALHCPGRSKSCCCIIFLLASTRDQGQTEPGIRIPGSFIASSGEESGTCGVYELNLVSVSFCCGLSFSTLRQTRALAVSDMKQKGLAASCYSPYTHQHVSTLDQASTASFVPAQTGVWRHGSTRLAP